MHLDRLAKVEKEYGERTRIAMGHGQPMLTHHFRGELDDHTKFVYCPIGFIVSWNDGDYTHEYCPWCKQFFSELT